MKPYRYTFSVEFAANTPICGEEIYEVLSRVINDASERLIELRDEVRISPLEEYDELP